MRNCRVLVIFAAVFAVACVASDATGPTAELKLVEWGSAGTSGPPGECQPSLRADGTASMLANVEECEEGEGPPPFPNPCPPPNTGCIDSLRPTDSTEIISALSPAKMRTYFSHDSIRTKCEGAFNKLSELWVNTQVKRGHVDPTVNDHHDAGWDEGNDILHVDTDFLDRNETPETTLGLLLHEAGHAAGFGGHPSGKDANGRYIDFPYNFLTHVGGGDQCVKWPGQEA